MDRDREAREGYSDIETKRGEKETARERDKQR